MDNFNALGIDIGGSHITVGLINLHRKEMIAQTYFRRTVDSKAPLTEIIADWATTIKQSYKEANVATVRIGIAMPGPFDYEKGVSLMQNQDKYDALYGYNVKELLAEALNIKPTAIQMKNDAACFLQGEVFSGSAIGYQRVIGLTLGTGLGTAVYKNETVEECALWNTPFLDSIAEDYIASRWFTKRFTEMYPNHQPISNVKELCQRIKDQSISNDIFEEFGENLGNFLVFFSKKEKAEAIVLGGNIANAFHWFEDSLKATLKRSAVNIPICIASLGENSALIGAASLWL
ncbi:ROK family protein [Pedobacter arcticus]|uniref:ROK family protein n=1 Tax=Pedobacter arcticus TaxID=752140 RepID=UPI0002E485D1|nr:ROK family protein [Pedobacter arcticus]